MVGIMLIMDVQNSVSVLRIKLADKTIAKETQINLGTKVGLLLQTGYRLYETHDQTNRRCRPQNGDGKNQTSLKQIPQDIDGKFHCHVEFPLSYVKTAYQ